MNDFVENVVPLETFHCGVQATMEEVRDGESVWLEVIGDFIKSLELYPGGPRGRLTGSFSSRVHGAFFQPLDLEASWVRLGPSAFWHTLMGVDRTPPISKRFLMSEGDRLKADPHAVLDQKTNYWLQTAGCLDQGRINGRWDIVKNIFDHSSNPILAGERVIMNHFLYESSYRRVGDMVGEQGIVRDSYRKTTDKIRMRGWLIKTSVRGRDQQYVVSPKGQDVLTTGFWAAKYVTRKLK